ncbi:hypothetical protein [Sphingobium sp. DC-2]|uniref:hypothetical protein n=1 Tax=Sphingobium sp. DC-2 TaxID=1303256 RepID=UPI0004C2FBDB|nr:hypothetical protein [Sphingobium sp. DC-2]
MAEELAWRNEIVGIAGSGLVLQIDETERVAPWSAISSISVVMALVDRTSERRIPVFVFGIMDGADERLFVVGETEPMWERLTSILSDFLPGIPPVDIWRGELAASGQASLYDRVVAEPWRSRLNDPEIH